MATLTLKRPPKPPAPTPARPRLKSRPAQAQPAQRGGLDRKRAPAPHGGPRWPHCGGIRAQGADKCLVAWAEARGHAVWIDRRHGVVGLGGWGTRTWRPSTAARAAASATRQISRRVPSSSRGLSRRSPPGVLVCRWYPRRCHGDTLARVANELASSRQGEVGR
jgi:hypothetical protein